MNQAALLRFRKSAVQVTRDLWPATITLSGRHINCSVHLAPITLMIPGQGPVEHRSLSALIPKTTLLAEPAIGAVLTYNQLDYIVNSTSGRGPTEPAWKLICIEKDRS